MRRMCLIAVAWLTHPRWSLALIGNRDEFHARAASAADFQPDARQVYGGRDLEKQGSWLQLSARRRLATVTNVRAGPMPDPAPRSRGRLVAEFVRGHEDAASALAALELEAAHYGRFNLLLWDGTTLALAGNHPRFAQREVSIGVHGISNGDFDAAWPKVKRARAALAHWLQDHGAELDPDLTPLFDALADERPAPDAQLPDTGVGLELERLLSPPFIRGERYGTRASTVVLVSREHALFAERRFGPNGTRLGEGTQRVVLG
jgi:uncharacterized protein with NRDE domain